MLGFRIGHCEKCGMPIAPEAMLERITALLGAEHAAAAQVIGRYCLVCRESAGPSGRQFGM